MFNNNFNVINMCRQAKAKETLEECRAEIDTLHALSTNSSKSCTQALAILQSTECAADNGLYDQVFLLIEEANKAKVVFTDVKSSLSRTQKLYLVIWMFKNQGS